MKKQYTINFTKPCNKEWVDKKLEGQSDRSKCLSDHTAFALEHGANMREYAEMAQWVAKYGDDNKDTMMEALGVLASKYDYAKKSKEILVYQRKKQLAFQKAERNKSL